MKKDKIIENKLPLVSVILPAYNCANTISEAIDSIIAQTYSEWELIVCDDCSTDTTYEVLKKYKKKVRGKNDSSFKMKRIVKLLLH